MATAYTGKDAAVKLNGGAISLMGTWSLSGQAVDLLEMTAFQDEYKQYTPGLKDGGTISFSGLYDGTDTAGQTALRNYNANNTSVTDIRLYVNDTSYWTPSTTSPLSFCWVTSFEIGAEISSLATASFEMKVSGKMVLV